MSVPLTYETAMSRIRKKFPNMKFEPDGKFININTSKIKVICPKHGISIKPYVRLLKKRTKYACAKCGREASNASASLSKDEAQKKLEAKYPDLKFILPDDYKNTYDKVKIICPKHGESENVVKFLLSKRYQHGCKECYKESRIGVKLLPVEEVIARAKKYHPEYDYSKVDYKGMHTKVKVICPKHGEFMTKPNDLVNGHGCRKCADEKCRILQPKDWREYVKQSEAVHKGVRYIKNPDDTLRSSNKVLIHCNVCNRDYTQLLTDHLNGRGCKWCNASSYEKAIVEKLEEYGINFVFQYRVTVNDRYYWQDFYLPDINVILEHHGKHHYLQKKYDSVITEEYVATTRRNDAIKEQAAKEKGINYHIISYKEDTIKALDNILKQYYRYKYDGKLFLNNYDLFKYITNKHHDVYDHITTITNMLKKYISGFKELDMIKNNEIEHIWTSYRNIMVRGYLKDIEIEVFGKIDDRKDIVLDLVLTIDFTKELDIKDIKDMIMRILIKKG